MKPRVVILSLSSDYGCQVQISNYPLLLEMLSTFELVYWQLVSSAPMPEEYEVALIEGAVTTDEQVALLKEVRDIASCVIAIGACAVTGGIPGLATGRGIRTQLKEVYGSRAPQIQTDARKPAPISDIIAVDFCVPGCPIVPAELSRILQRALRALADDPERQTMCGQCKIAENTCLWVKGTPCLGLVARSGCNASCVSCGRACTACRGIARDANLASAYTFAEVYNCSQQEFDALVDIYNAATEVAS